MREPSYRSRRSMTVTLLIVNVVAFFVQCVVYGHYPPVPNPFVPNLGDYFALSVEGLRHGYVWQLLTFQLMHGSPTHLLFNCLAIYIFGREVEEALGRKSFLTLYFTSGVIGGLFQAPAGGLLPGPFPGATVC